MAKPQLEDGHTQIAHEILEALARTYLSPNENKIVIFVIRKTYGWHKKMDWISQSQIKMATGIRKSHASRTIKRLVGRNILIKDGKSIGFQKDYERWLGIEKLGTTVTEEPATILDDVSPKFICRYCNEGGTGDNPILFTPGGTPYHESCTVNVT